MEARFHHGIKKINKVMQLFISQLFFSEVWILIQLN